MQHQRPETLIPRIDEHSSPKLAYGFVAVSKSSPSHV